MNLTPFLLSILIGLLALQDAVAQGSSGSGNRGEGVYCSLSNKLHVLDTFQIERKNKNVSLEGMSTDESFNLIWNRFALGFEHIPQFDRRWQEGVHQQLHQILKQIGSIDRWTPEDLSQKPTHDGGYTEDRLPKDCKIVQLARLNFKDDTIKNQPFSKDPAKWIDHLSVDQRWIKNLTKHSARVLEMHEVLYLFGFLEGDHASSILTQQLLNELLRLKPRPREIAKKFLSWYRGRGLQLGQRPSSAYIPTLSGTYRLHDPRLASVCPTRVLVEELDERQYQIYLGWDHQTPSRHYFANHNYTTAIANYQGKIRSKLKDNLITGHFTLQDDSGKTLEITSATILGVIFKHPPPPLVLQGTMDGLQFGTRCQYELVDRLSLRMQIIDLYRNSK